MRYRPFGHSGASVSVTTLVLTDDMASRGSGACRELIFAALEAGVNGFHLRGERPELAQFAGQALGHVERKLLFISAAFGGPHQEGRTRDYSPEGVSASIRAFLVASGLERIDLLMFEQPGPGEIRRETVGALRALRKAGTVKRWGVGGDDERVERYVETGAFDVLATPYSLLSGWKDRNRLKSAVAKGMSVIGYDHLPDGLSSKRKAESVGKSRKRFSLFGGGKQTADNPLAGAGGYGFLHETEGWSAEQLCLAYALTEPAITTVWMEASDPNKLEALTLAAERELPSNVPAQIEMARFGEVA